MQTHIQYLYTTETLKRKIARVDGTKTWNPRGKAGQTGQENATIRIDQQDGTSTVEPLIPLKEKEVPIWITDKMVRDELLDKGYALARVDKDREWIDFVGLDDEYQMIWAWLEVLHELEHGVTAVEDFEPDDYQKEFAQWTLDRWTLGATALGNFSKMRSGKCMMGHLAAKANNFKKVLVISGKPGALKGWGELLVGGKKAHVLFADNHFHHYKDQKNKPVKWHEGTNTVAVGYQWIHKHMKTGGNALLKQILETEWDAVYIDESHKAKDTKLAQLFHSKLKVVNDRWLNLTGTPFKTLLTNEIAPEDRWAFDYVAEQKLRKWLLENDPQSPQAERFRYLPKVNYAMMHVPSKVKDLLNGENFNLGANGLWATDKKTKELVFPEAVSEMINYIRQQGYKNVPDVFKPYVDLHTRHSFWLLPDNVAAIKRVRDQLERHPYFKKFQILVATGDESKDEKTIRAAVDRIEQGISEYKGTITISCGQLVEGTTVPQWCAVHQLNSDKSVTDYFQSGFRNGSPWPEGDKQEVCVYDYDPERFVQMVYTLAVDYCDRENGQSPSDWIATEWNEVSDVYDFTDNKWNTLNAKDIILQATEDISAQTDMFQDISLVNPKGITDEIVAAVEDSDYTKNQSGSSNLNSNDLETGSVSSTKTDNSQPTGEKTTDQITVTRLQILEAVKKIPNLIYISYDYAFEIKSIFDIPGCHEIELVKDHTGLTTVQWSCIIDSIDTDKLNRRIDAYVNSQ